MKASDLFLLCLEERGVKYMYGVPGEENADIMISLLNSSIEFIICNHEQSAAFMADMYGRLTGTPGICLSTLGPGATNLATGVVSAQLDHSPLIAIIGQAATTRLHKESHQNVHAIPMYQPVTKWATSIRDQNVIPEVLEKAFKVAITSKPGAVVVELPENIAKEDTDAKPIYHPVNKFERGVESHHVEMALELIENAQAPLLLVGSGAVRESCDKELKEFMDKTGIYGAVTFMGKGAISARNPKSLYCVGLGMKDIALKAFDESDLVIAIGYDMVEWHPDRWNSGCQKKIIHIDTLPAEVDKNYLPEIELVGEITGILRQINSKLTNKQKKDESKFAKIRDEITADLEKHSDDDSFPMKPQRILSDLRKEMRDDDILISDVGAHKMWVARQYPTYKPNTCFISNGFCSMGIAMPSAFTAKQLYPEKRIVALCGDGGFIMSIQALATAGRYKMPFTVLVWEDHQYGLIEWKQEMEFGKHSHIDLNGADLVKVAEGFGCKAVRLTAVEEFVPELKKAFAEKHCPSVIVIPVDYSENLKLTKRLGELLSH